MLVTTNKQIHSTFERIIKDTNGVLIRVRFIIVEVNGKIQGQILSATPLATQAEAGIKSTTEKVLALPFIQPTAEVAEDSTPHFISVLSPYISLDFLMSQPTRAPSFI